VFDPDHPDAKLGKSKAAAEKAVMQTAISRYLFGIPIIFPAVILYGIERMGRMPKRFGPLTSL